ncbi:cytochrome b [Paracoccus sp. TK19116]|uniref:Cytochrome b n=2 Tax=Paracoccus albicereus TaxID=2922394 RepID=A0ABT1MUM5_9RHOB|nr:cytochrome b [Paracoccus albicereus]MCQ0972022.1 cytochrome b [Paracoccus albicereus]
MKPTPSGYRPPARWLHWLTALLVLLMIPAGLIMVREGLPRPVQDTLFLFHKNAGVIVFLLMVVRLIYRWRNPPPPLPASVPDWQRLAARLSHGALYLLAILLPITGYVRVRADRYPIEGLDALGIGTMLPKSEALAGAASELHETLAFLLIAVLLVHLAAAIQHAVVKRDGIWARMWPPTG